MKKLLSLTALVLLLAACGGNGGTPAPLALTAADSGTTVGLEPGQAVEITLESNASTGYAWNLVEEPDSSVLTLVSSEYVEPDTPEGVVGAAGTEAWKFQAVAAGTASLKLAYFRSFEPESVGGEFQLTVDVR